ncbi:MAG: hypothetical protein ACRCWM_10260 [Sarcina sp.]
MKYIEGDISLKLSGILDKKLSEMLVLIFEFNSEIISEINYDFPSVISNSIELKESLVEKINLYSEMYEKIKIIGEFEFEVDKELVRDFNGELDELIKVSKKLTQGIKKSEVDILRDTIIEFEELCKDYDEEIVMAGDYEFI